MYIHAAVWDRRWLVRPANSTSRPRVPNPHAIGDFGRARLGASYSLYFVHDYLQHPLPIALAVGGRGLSWVTDHAVGCNGMHALTEDRP